MAAAMGVTLAEIAERFGCGVAGDSATVVDCVATLSAAAPGAVSFFANPLFRDQLRRTRASAVILAAESVGDCPVASLIAANPYATYARVAAYLSPPPALRPGIDSSAQVASSALIAPTAEIGPLAVVGERVSVGERAVVGPGCVIGAGVSIGPDTRLVARVTVLERCVVGARGLVHPGVVIGADGFGFAPDGGTWVKVPQLGAVVVGDDVEIGANTTIDRGTIESTVIEDGVKLDNLVQIAHNARIGAHTVMAAMSGVAGSTEVGKRCMIGGGAVMINHLKICDDVLVTFRSVVTKSIASPGMYSGSLPADEASQWRRNAARFRSLDKLVARLRAVETAVKQLTGQGRRNEND